MTDENPQPRVETEAMMLMADQLTRFIEVAAGHREKALAAGFSPTIAEQMAFTVHQGLCIKAFGTGD